MRDQLHAYTGDLPGAYSWAVARGRCVYVRQLTSSVSYIVLSDSGTHILKNIKGYTWFGLPCLYHVSDHTMPLVSTCTQPKIEGYRFFCLLCLLHTFVRDVWSEHACSKSTTATDKRSVSLYPVHAHIPETRRSLHLVWLSLSPLCHRSYDAVCQYIRVANS